MSLWDEIPADMRNSGALDTLEPLLDGVGVPTSAEETDADGTWRVFRDSFGPGQPLSLDPATGSFRRGAGTGSTPLEFPDPQVDVELGLHLAGPGGAPDGGIRVIVGTPGAVLRLPFLRGAVLDAQGQLRADPAHPDVRFLIPAIRIKVQRLAGQALGVSLLSATAGGGPPVDQIFDFIRMEPPHALIGPGDVVGFAFRTAILDLSATSGPTGVPPGAFVQPGDSPAGSPSSWIRWRHRRSSLIVPASRSSMHLRLVRVFTPNSTGRPATR